MFKFKLGQHVIASEDFEAFREMRGGGRLYRMKVADVKEGQEAIITGYLHPLLAVREVKTLFHILDYALVVPLSDDHWEYLNPDDPIVAFSSYTVIQAYGRDFGGHLWHEEDKN